MWSLLREGGGPIEDDRDWSASGCARQIRFRPRQDKPLSICRNRVNVSDSAHGLSVIEIHEPRFKHGVRGREFEHRPVGPGFSGKQSSKRKRIHIEQFAAVPAPSRKSADIAGNLPFAGAPRKGLDVDFSSARFVRLVRDPFSIW